MAPTLAMRRDEPLPSAIHRIGIGLLDRAATGLSSRDRDSAVHEAGQAIEEARARLRLVGPATGQRVFRFEDKQLSDALQLVAPSRDGYRVLPALDALVERFGDRLAQGTFDALRYQLEDRRSPASDEQIAGALEILVAARTRYSDFAITSLEDSFFTIEPGLYATYHTGRIRMGEAYRTPTDVAFQRWRTEVCYLRDQSSMLDPDWATLDLSERLRKLAMSLGEARDLTSLATEAIDDALGEEERELLRLLVTGRCQDVYRQVMPVGDLLYGDHPGDFIDRFGAYWRGWRSH
jgi:hypothetical protein